MKTDSSPNFYPFTLTPEPGQCKGCQIRKQRASWAYLAIQCKNYAGECFAKWYAEILGSGLSEWHITNSFRQVNELLQDEEGSHSVECGEGRNVSVQKIPTDQIQHIASATLPPPYEVLINNQHYSFKLSTEDGLTKYHLGVDHERFCLILKETGVKLVVPIIKGAINTLTLERDNEVLHQSAFTSSYNFASKLLMDHVYRLEVNNVAYTIQLIHPMDPLR